MPNGITNGYGSTVAMGLALAPRIGKGSKAVAGVRVFIDQLHPWIEIKWKPSLSLCVW